MGLTEANNIATLLPTARIELVVHDDALKTHAEALKNDWRFARVQMQAVEGNVETAIQRYKSHKSPDLVIIETDTIDESFPAKLEQLAEHCDANTAAIIIGPVNDVYLYRRLIDMGVSDYLVKPLTAETLAEVMGRTLIQRLGTTESTLVSFIGAKGGTGTSTLALLAAQANAGHFDEKTLFLDWAGGWSYACVSLGLESSTTLQQAARAAVTNDPDSLKRMVLKAADNLSVLASGLDTLLDDSIDEENAELLLNRLMENHPYVFLDLSGIAHKLQRRALQKSGHIVIVATPTLPSLRAARALYQEISDLRGGQTEHVHIVINKEGTSSTFDIPRKDIEAALPQKPAAYITNDTKLFTLSEIEGQSPLNMKGREALEAQINHLLQSILGKHPQEKKKEASSKGFSLGGLFSKDKGR
ncbi:MAG: type II secretion protein ATPase [Alphaproteobacteria bacterium]|nr:type II secretion protein ATPase [Alphaproteobacteria bacterium]